MEKTTNRARMTAAHELTRATLAKYGEADYRATFGLCLRAVWAAMPAAPAADGKPAAAQTARAEWEAMSGEEQAAAALAMVWYEVGKHKAAAKVVDGEIVDAYNPFEWVVTEDNAREVVAEMFCRMDGKLARAEEKDPARPLALILHSAAHAAAVYIDRMERRNARALRIESGTDKDGNETSREYIIDNAAPIAEPIAPSPENALIIRDMIERAAADDTDRAIIAALAAGYSQPEIARRLDMNQSSISRRIEKIRARAFAED